MVGWVINLIAGLFILLSIIGFGRFFIKTAISGEINMFLGYRSPMSTKNKETWAFAHLYCGRLWWRAGLIMLPLIIAVMIVLLFFVRNENVEITVVILGVVATQGVPVLFLIISIILTEIALRKNFDRLGNRRY